MARRQQEKSHETRDELYESAIQLFGSKGFSGTTIAEITDNAGYAKGNFYRYWKSKDDLFLQIMEERLRGYRAAREKSLNDAHSIEEATSVIIAFLESMLDDGNWAKIFLEFTIHASGSDQLKAELNKSIYRLSSDMFAEIMSPFNVSGFSLKKIGGLVTALFEGYLIQSILNTNVIDKEDLGKAIMALIVPGKALT